MAAANNPDPAINLAELLSATFYQLLNVSPTASAEEVERNRRVLAMLYHPDRHGGTREATEAMARINLAAATLIDQKLRADYNETLSSDDLADVNAIPLHGCYRFSEGFTSKLPAFAAEYRGGGVVFLDEKAVAQKFSEQWAKTTKLMPEAQLPLTSVDVCEDVTAEEGNSSYSELLSYLQLDDLESVYTAKLRWPDETWRRVLQRFWLSGDSLPISAVCRPLKAFLLAMAEVVRAADSQARLTAHVKLADAMWAMLLRHRDNEVSRRDVGSTVVQLALDEMEFGGGHASALLRNYALADDEQTKRLLPSEQLTSKLLFAEEITEERNGKRVVIVSGYSVPRAQTDALRKVERAVAKKLGNGEFSHRLAGDYYLDVVLGCLSIPQMIFACLAAVKCYLQAYLLSSQTSEQRYALKKLVLDVLKFSWCIVLMYAKHAYMLLHVSGTAFVVVRRMLLASPSLATQEDVDILNDYASNFADQARFVPLPFTPNLLCCEADLFSMFSGDIQSTFLLHAQTIDEAVLPMPRCFLYSEIYANHVHGVRQLTNPAVVREVAMETFLSQRRNQMSWSDVESFVRSPAYGYDTQGFLSGTTSFPKDIAGRGIRGIRALLIDFQTGAVRFEFAYDDRQALISAQDLHAAMQCECVGAIFSLDGISEDHVALAHPLQATRFGPPGLAGSEFLHTLFLADYLMKQISIGEEVSYTTPFKTRPLDESPIWQKLPSKLREALAPLAKRGAKGNLVCRFWIQAENLDISTYQDNKGFCAKFGEVKVSVRTHRLTPDANGKLVDTDDESTQDSPEKKFAADFTHAYDKLAVYYPVLARLKELMRIMFAGHYIRSVRRAMAEALARAEQRVGGIWEANVSAQASSVLSSIGEVGKPPRWDTSNRKAVIDGFGSHGVAAAEVEAWLDSRTSDSGFARLVAERVHPYAKVYASVVEPHRAALNGIDSFIASLQPAQSAPPPARKDHVVPAVYKLTMDDEGMIRSVVYGGVNLIPKLTELDGTSALRNGHSWSPWQCNPTNRTIVSTNFRADGSGVGVPLRSTAPAGPPTGSGNAGGGTIAAGSGNGGGGDNNDKQRRLEAAKARGQTKGKVHYMETGADGVTYVRRQDLSTTNSKDDRGYKIPIGNERVPEFTAQHTSEDFISNQLRLTVRCSSSKINHRYRNVELRNLEQARALQAKDFEVLTGRSISDGPKAATRDGKFSVVAHDSSTTGGVPSVDIVRHDGGIVAKTRYMHFI